MKYLTIFVFCFFVLNVNAETLVTPTYEISVEWKCGEGSVSCDNIEFQVFNKKNDTTEKYIGKSNHSICADGVTPCKFQGYEFDIGNLNYSLYMRGLVEVVKDNAEIVLTEEGKWHY